MDPAPKPMYDRIYRPAREAELDGTQAIADAIAPAPEEPFFTYSGIPITFDNNAPSGTIWLSAGNTFYVYTGTTWEKMDGTK